MAELLSCLRMDVFRGKSGSPFLACNTCEDHTFHASGDHVEAALDGLDENCRVQSARGKNPSVSMHLSTCGLVGCQHAKMTLLRVPYDMHNTEPSILFRSTWST